MLLLARKQTFTLPEFLDHLRAKENPGEYIATKIMKNNKLKTMSTFVIASLMYCEKALGATADALGKIDKAGITMLSIVRTIGYWICLIMCVVEILRGLMQGDTKGIGKIIIKYLLAFAAFYALPWFFDIIKGIFG